ncbi:MAG: RNA-directed DNA polymerase [Clostridia bacterium]|nr:RNA-directed DNA polymerase [Clostridia bacterium]
MTSQVLAIFYLNDMDHFIKEKLKIYGVIRYQDDFLLFHKSKEYLKNCFKELKQFLKKENLELNKKTRIFKNTDNFIFIGRNKYGNYAKYRTVKRRLKKRKYLYLKGFIPINSLISSRLCYKHLLKKE